jgi:hypothetical protein
MCTIANVLGSLDAGDTRHLYVQKTYGRPMRLELIDGLTPIARACHDGQFRPNVH